jgi:hypothetical protein
MSNNGQTSDMPNPEELKRATAFALKNSKWASGAVADPLLTDEDKARLRLEQFVIKVMDTCAIIKHSDEEKTGLPFDTSAMSGVIMSMFMEFTDKECKEALRFLLSMVHTGMIIEALKELP